VCGVCVCVGCVCVWGVCGGLCVCVCVCMYILLQDTDTNIQHAYINFICALKMHICAFNVCVHFHIYTNIYTHIHYVYIHI
jgi:hypothetical protein